MQEAAGQQDQISNLLREFRKHYDDGAASRWCHDVRGFEPAANLSVVGLEPKLLQTSTALDETLRTSSIPRACPGRRHAGTNPWVGAEG